MSSEMWNICMKMESVVMDTGDTSWWPKYLKRLSTLSNYFRVEKNQIVHVFFLFQCWVPKDLKYVCVAILTSLLYSRHSASFGYNLLNVIIMVIFDECMKVY